MDQKQIDLIQQQERNYEDLGFNRTMGKVSQETSGPNFLSAYESSALLQGISASKIATGVQRSNNGAIEINWDEGYIQINFPGNVGYLKHGFVGTNNKGNKKFGTLLNDGITNRSFEGV